MRVLSSSLGLLGTLALAGGPAPARAQHVGSEFQVNTYTTGAQRTCSRHGGNRIAADASGNFVVVWHGDGQGDPSYGIFSQRYDSAGEALGSEFRVNAYTSGRQWRPAVAADASGNFVVVWENESPQDGSDDGVFGQRYDSGGGALGGEFRVNTATTDSQGYPSLAADAGGNFVVVWRSRNQDGSGWGIFGQRYDSAGEALGSEFRVNTTTSGEQNFPSVAAAPNGDFVVVWSDGVNIINPRKILGQRYDSAGEPQGVEFGVSQAGGSSVHDATVATDAAGNFVVVWANGSRVVARRYDSAGGALGEEFTVDRSGIPLRPHVGSDAAGNFLVVWTVSQQFLASEVAGRYYDSMGEPQADKFQVNSFTSGLQECGSVAATSRDRFVVVWQSPPQQGSNTDVFGQRLDFAQEE